MRYDAFLGTPITLPNEKSALYEILPGATARSVANELAQGGLLSSADFFYWHARISDQAARIRAGEYRIQPGMTPPQLLALFVSGPMAAYQLTIVEGWTFKQMRSALEQDGKLQVTLAGLSDTEVMNRLGLPGEHPEGLFFPDTYSFPRGMTDLEFLKRAYERMQVVLQESWARRADDAPVKTPYEALILASIVEKETGVPHERAAIAGVFARRLRKGMKLQTDPTVIYGMGDTFDGNIRRRDLLQDTPYNTYVHRGLPPTPICLPGREAIEAALAPENGKSLYFVAKGDGSHYFSNTLEEHNGAVRKYQLGGK